MKSRGYSLVEVMVGAAIVAIGLTAAAILVGTIMRQQEVNAATLRAANLQEQAVSLYRLGMEQPEITDLLPESGYSFNFSSWRTNLASSTVSIDVEVTACTMTYPNPSGEGQALNNTVRIVRPSIRAD